MKKSILITIEAKDKRHIGVCQDEIRKACDGLIWAYTARNVNRVTITLHDMDDEKGVYRAIKKQNKS